MGYWIVIGAAIVAIAAVLKRILPPWAASLLGLAVQIVFALLAALVAGYCFWIVSSLRPQDQGWSVLIFGIGIPVVLVLFFFGHFVGRYLRRSHPVT